jgi:CheY-like chemotaxis protein
VLVVDDNRALAAVIAESLEHVDDELSATYTTEPQQALRKLEDGVVDCLVTDYEMPELDGLTLVDETATDTPFILYTYRPAERLAEGARERGGEYLHKQTGAEQYHRLARLVHEQVQN